MKRDLAKRFMAFVDKQDKGCWIWTGSKNPSGYGMFTMGRKFKLAHRLSWEFTYGFEPVNLIVCHICDNRACINPEHLFLGDNKDNATDKVKKGRHVQAYGNSKLTINDVREIRKLWLTGNHSQYSLATRFGVQHSCIGRIINRDRWGGIDLEPIDKELWKKIHIKRKLMNLSGVSA